MQFKINNLATAVLVTALALGSSASLGLAQVKEYCFTPPDRLVTSVSCEDVTDRRTGQSKLECTQDFEHIPQPEVCTPVEDTADSRSREDYRNSEYRDRRGYSDHDEPDEYGLENFDPQEAERCKADRNLCDDDDLELMIHPWEWSGN